MNICRNIQISIISTPYSLLPCIKHLHEIYNIQEKFWGQISSLKQHYYFPILLLLCTWIFTRMFISSPIHVLTAQNLISHVLQHYYKLSDCIYPLWSDLIIFYTFTSPTQPFHLPHYIPTSRHLMGNFLILTQPH